MFLKEHILLHFKSEGGINCHGAHICPYVSYHFDIIQQGPNIKIIIQQLRV